MLLQRRRGRDRIQLGVSSLKSVWGGKCVRIIDYRGLGDDSINPSALASNLEVRSSNSADTQQSSLKHDEILFYPNPVSGIGQIEFSASNFEGASVNINIVNYLGQVLQSKPMMIQEGRNTESLDFSALSKGFYFITISTQEGSLIATKRVVKN